MIVLRFVGDRADYIAGGESKGSAKGGKRGNEYGDHNFDDLLLGHNRCVFLFDEGQYKQPKEVLSSSGRSCPQKMRKNAYSSMKTMG